jgi:hypothetical protein
VGALCALLAVPGLFADDQNQDKAQSQSKSSSSTKATDESKTTDTSTSTDKASLPACLKEIDLSQDQKDKIRMAISKSQTQLEQLRKEFDSMHLQAVELEATMVAAIEDGLSDMQRERLRQQRRKTQIEGTNTGASNNGNSTDRDKANGKSGANATTQRQTTGNKPATSNRQPAGRNATSRPAKGENAAGDDEEVLIIGVALSPEQQSQADDVSNAYDQELQTIWRQLQEIHMQMVAVEADKMTTIEQKLSEDQLKQLRASRQKKSKSSIQAEKPEDKSRQ